jgi:YD repeat-containing protein
MGQHPGGTLGTDIQRLDYDGSGNLIYLGIAHPGELSTQAVWQIRKFAYDGSGNLLSMLYANGSKKFDQVWDDRAGLTYS